MRAHTATAPKLTDSELDGIRTLIEKRSAILFDSSRERFFSTRVREYAEETGVASSADLLHQLKNSTAEYDALLERLLTQETSFFRYPSFLEAFEKKVVPEIQQRKALDDPRALRIWSAGCSTGEEPYSIAIRLCETIKCSGAWEVNILATDISRRALQIAESGTYSKRSVGAMPDAHVQAYFTPTKKGFQVKPRIRKMISFSQMNLAEPAYVGKVDCIFCMNVLMYFSKERRMEVLRHFYEALEPSGYFLLGHAETLADAPLNFEPVSWGDCRIYRKKAAMKSREHAAEANR